MRRDEALRQLQAVADAKAARGSLLFHLDLATELARAALAERGIRTDDLVAIVDEQGYGVLALNDGAAPDLIAMVRFAGDGAAMPVPATGAPPYPASAMAQARRAVEHSFPGYAALVVPPVPRAGTSVALEAYAIMRAARRGDIALGMHWHMLLLPDGRAIHDRTPLAEGAVSLSGRTALSLDAAGPVPGEIFTYLSLKHGVKLDVQTRESGIRWRVEGERTSIGIVAPTRN